MDAIRNDGFPRVRHRDQPSLTEQRRRSEILRHARLPRGGVFEVWAGDRPDEVRWRRIG
jgi:hypothetical protein